MMENLIFENSAGNVFVPSVHGILLKAFSAPAPTPKVFRETLDGMDGELDFTEYAGEVRYNNREITASFRDMSGKAFRQMMNILSGQRLKITYTETPDFYYSGRCEEILHAEQDHVVDLECRFICGPYCLAKAQTVIQRTVSESSQILLKAARMSAIPSIEVSSPMELSYDGNTVQLDAAGVYVLPQIVITQTPKTLSASGSGNIRIAWQDGVM